MKISVVVPAHNRPDLLKEAVASVVAQTHADWELVVVDDGSQPAIDAATLQAIVGNRGVFLRHDVALGVSRAKNSGIRAASGEIVTLLDDDDLLVPTALATVRRAFVRHPELDCVFMGVEPFGPYAQSVAGSRAKAIAPFLALGRRGDDDLYFFDDGLFEALVRSVPIDFQRPAARRGAWNILGGFDEAGLFSESAWAIRAATACHIALAEGPLTRWRIHGSNFGWLQGAGDQAAKLRQVDNTLASGQALMAHFRQQLAMVRGRLTILESRLADNYFDKAYLLRGERSAEGLRALLRAMALRPRIRHLKLLLRYLLPWGTG